MKRNLSLIASIALCLAGAFTAVAAQSGPEQKPIKASVVEILKEPSKYDGAVVKVIAEVRMFAQKTSRAGNKYFTFKLRQGDSEINGYGRGELGKSLKDGAKVEVVGVYRVEKKLGDLVFKNEIDCTKAEGKPYGIKEVEQSG